MAKFVSNYPGMLVLPDKDQTVIAHGAKFDLTKDDLANAGVKEWIETGWIIEAGKVKVAASSEDSDAQKAALEAANGTVTALTAELDAERAKTAALEARVADLTAQIEAATAPRA